MNKLERDSKQKEHDVLMMGASTQEIVKDSGWHVPRETHRQTEPHERTDSAQTNHQVLC